jgi:glucokinase
MDRILPVGSEDTAMRIIGAVDIGGTKIAAGGVTEDGTIVHRCERPTDPARGFPDAVQRISQMLRAVEARCSARFDGIGIACPGPLDPKSGVLGEVGTLPGWQNGNLCQDLQKDFGVAIAVENDADAAALAEAAWGSARGTESFIYLTFSTGIGGGIIIQGKLYRGVDGSHPELGHQVIDLSGPLCYCSAHGCWESLASGSALSASMHSLAPDRPLLSAAEVCALATQGDELARECVKRLGFYLGLGLANIITLFSPQVIALGGGLMKSSQLFLEDALQTMRRTCTQVPAEKTKITLASLAGDVGLLGAARSWLHRYG